MPPPPLLATTCDSCGSESSTCTCSRLISPCISCISRLISPCISCISRLISVPRTIGVPNATASPLAASAIGWRSDCVRRPGAIRPAPPCPPPAEDTRSGMPDCSKAGAAAQAVAAAVAALLRAHSPRALVLVLVLALARVSFAAGCTATGTATGAVSSGVWAGLTGDRCRSSPLRLIAASAFAIIADVGGENAACPHRAAAAAAAAVAACTSSGHAPSAVSAASPTAVSSFHGDRGGVNPVLGDGSTGRLRCQSSSALRGGGGGGLRSSTIRAAA